MAKGAEELKNLEDALIKEREAAQSTAEAIGRVRAAIEAFDAAGQRRTLGAASEAFNELTRRSALRNAIAARILTALGLKRDDTVETLIHALGRQGARIAGLVRELYPILRKVKEAVGVLGLLSRYGSAMTASLIEIRGTALAPASYGRNGHRRANFTRSGRLA